MAFTYDPSTDAGAVRLMIMDTDETTSVFTDAEVAAALSRMGSSVNRAAAMLLRALAVNKAKLEKRIKALDIEVDSKGVVAALLSAAKALDAADDDGGGFALAGMVQDAFGFRECVVKNWMRDGTV